MTESRDRPLRSTQDARYQAHLQLLAAIHAANAAREAARETRRLVNASRARWRARMSVALAEVVAQRDPAR